MAERDAIFLEISLAINAFIHCLAPTADMFNALPVMNSQLMHGTVITFDGIRIDTAGNRR